MNWKDEIVEEVRSRREAYAAQFNYDIARIVEDLKRKEARHPDRLADLQPLEILVTYLSRAIDGKGGRHNPMFRMMSKCPPSVMLAKT
jgi:hypothetical protein